MSDLSQIITRPPDLELVGYLRRWCLIPRNREMNIYLHHILAPDEPVFHDHPWTFETKILSGSYVACRPAKYEPHDFTRYGMSEGERLLMGAGELHYIESVKPDTWTLVTTGPVVKDWGFLVNGKMVPHQDYEGDREFEVITRNGYDREAFTSKEQA